jgi:hypothetical protein
LCWGDWRADLSGITNKVTKQREAGEGFTTYMNELKKGLKVTTMLTTTFWSRHSLPPLYIITMAFFLWTKLCVIVLFLSYNLFRMQKPVFATFVKKGLPHRVLTNTTWKDPSLKVQMKSSAACGPASLHTKRFWFIDSPLAVHHIIIVFSYYKCTDHWW